jgi:hypothetical protein
MFYRCDLSRNFQRESHTMSHLHYAKARSEQEKKDIYDKWHKLINMSQKALDEWAENEDRLLASINRNEAKKEHGGIQSGYDSFHRIKRRKGKPFEDWSAEDFDNASQENGFNGRMLGGEPGDPVGDSGRSKWEISLRNWGHDPALKSSPAHAKWKAWKKKHSGKKASSTPTPSNIILEASRWLKRKTIETRREGVEIDPNVLDEFSTGFQSRLAESVRKHLDSTGALEYLSLQRSVGKLRRDARKIVTAFVLDPKAREVGSTWRVLTALISQFEEMLKASVKVEEDHLRIIEQNFTYKKFKVQSLNLSSFQTRGLLDSISYIEELFSSREMTSVVHEAISKIILRDPDEVEKKKGIAGLYQSYTKSVTILSTASKSKGRFMENFVHETLIHEIGHWVHLSYITQEAREFWDSGWGMISQKEEDFLSENIEKLTITAEDRERYFDLFMKHKGDASKVKKELGALDQLKVHEMSTTFTSEPFMTPKNFRLTKRGKEVAQAFSDPSHYFFEVQGHSRSDYSEEEAIERAFRTIKRIWFKVSGMYEGIGLTMEADKAEEFLSGERALHDQAIIELKEALGIPTDYGRTNVKEDFAETFVGFILNPSQLSEPARWRMGRTLGLSEAGGKKVMRTSAKRVASKYIEALQIRENNKNFIRAYLAQRG